MKQTEPPQSSQHGPSEDVSEKKDENEAKDGKAQQEKLVVAYVPEYPSKYYTHTHTYKLYTLSILPQDNTAMDVSQYKPLHYGIHIYVTQSP